MLYFAFLALFLPLCMFASDESAQGGFYRAALRHIEGGGIGYAEGYTTLEAFLAPDHTQWKLMPFFDARGHVFNNGKAAANAGIGLRTECEKRVYGINAYYDYRNLGRFHSNQVGVGLETLGEVLDFRINGYLPVGKKISEGYDLRYGGFSGNHLLLSQKFQSALKGFNAECGFHLQEDQCFDLYATAGTYFFTGKVAGSTWGVNASIAGTYNDLLSVEISDSYDHIFGNRLQAQVSIGFSFGPGKAECTTCRMASADRMLKPVRRQEIIVKDKSRKKTVAIDPTTNQPYFFVFVDNTSHSQGTYENPYHSFAQAQDHSSPNDVIYVFPGDGTTTGMDSGITLKNQQKLWGSGIAHGIQTTRGVISIPAQTSASPMITNTNIDTEGNAITLAANNAISGFTIASALNDAIYGTDPQNLDVSFCTFENTTTYAIEATFPGNALISITNNQFLNNVNGVFLNLSGTSNVVCVSNTFADQTSISSIPIEVVSSDNTLTAQIENNTFINNQTGSIRFGLNNVVDARISVLNNVITNNGTGSQSSLGSSFVVLPTGTIDNCAIELRGNTFSQNASNALYLHTSGAFRNLEVVATANTMSRNGGSGLVLATPVDALKLLVTDNKITECNDNGIAVIGSGKTSTGEIAINNNLITDIGNGSNGIAINQDFASLNLTILDNEINRCEGTGIVSYAPTGIDSLTLNVSDNAISNCQNLSSNAASGLDIEQYTSLDASVTNNTLTDNAGTSVVIGSTLPAPTACLTLADNSNSGEYLLTNPGDGTFNLSPCNVDSVNSGTISTSGVISPVQSCAEETPCAP